MNFKVLIIGALGAATGFCNTFSGNSLLLSQGLVIQQPVQQFPAYQSYTPIPQFQYQQQGSQQVQGFQQLQGFQQGPVQQSFPQQAYLQQAYPQQIDLLQSYQPAQTNYQTTFQYPSYSQSYSTPQSVPYYLTGPGVIDPNAQLTD